MNLNQTKRVAKQIASRLQQNNGGVVLLNAPMGAGKTTLVGMIVKILAPDAMPCSPTFAIINQYTENIFHVDLYRGQNDIGLQDLLIPGNYVFIEWPGDLVVPNAIHVKINIKENGNREFIIA